ncbi:tetratricopeptide repeat protein [Planktotalea sp.]|uniref:tetratricopeptide repeat protein n=1 Tax=Planktotalea sp. TaxID=2029877 RepID=UPI003298C1F5
MNVDICKCEISLTDASALEAWNGVVLEILAHGQNAPVHLNTLLETAPEFAMGHAIKGLAVLMLARREVLPVAVEANKSAQAALKAGGATAREALWCSALNDWINGAPTRSVERMEAALRLNPADTISMKMSHGIRFMLGDNHGMRRSVERVLPAHGVDHPLRGYVLGCLAFAMEETGSYADAERTGLMGLELAVNDAWGLHAVAHVYDMTHRVDDGIALIDQNAAAWGHCNNFRFHVWWHKALLHLDQGDVAKALDLYDTKIRDDKTDDFRDISNATSLLVRLQLDGVDVGHRWEELADLSEARVDDGCLVFADLHYMLALAGDKRTDAAALMTARIARDATGPGDMAQVMKAPGVAAAEGLAAFGEGDYQRAFAGLSAGHTKFQSLGGSHAQRDVFERLTIEAGLRAGRLDETKTLLDERTALRGGHEDTFAARRMSQIESARRSQRSIAAE